MKTISIARAACLVLSTGLPVGANARPVVLELFTSQSCSSCPPADELLAELTTQPDVFALDLHVDYWNGLGWRDPYSQPQFTTLQQHYAAWLNTGEVYTPELVVNGRQGVVGSDRAAVTAAIAAQRTGVSVPMRLHIDGADLVVQADAGDSAATLWLAAYAPSRTTRVAGGENGGRTLTEANVVLSLTQIGTWTGRAISLRVTRPHSEGAMVFLQAADGRVLGAARL